MIVKVSRTHYGAYLIRATSKKWSNKIRAHMALYVHHGAECRVDVFLQGEWELPDWVTPKHRKELAAGWDVRVQVDAWEALHAWGWDAHTLAE